MSDQKRRIAAIAGTLSIAAVAHMIGIAAAEREAGRRLNVLPRQHPTDPKRVRVPGLERKAELARRRLRQRGER